jgi:hypothetical protein
MRPRAACAIAPPLVSALDSCSTANVSLRQRRYAALRKIARPLLTLLAGIALGTTLLVNQPRGPALLARVCSS